MLETVNALIEAATGSPWAYPAVLVICAVDAFFPPVPSEAIVLAAAAVAADGGEHGLLGVILLAATGAFVGDHISYTVGRGIGGPIGRRLRRRRPGAAPSWARTALRTRGATIIVAARFIPGGRTATTVTAGAVRFPLPRFTLLDALAAVLWALYAGLLGFFAAGLFHGNHVLAVAVGIGLSLAISLVVEAARSAVRRRRTLSGTTGG